MIKINNTLENIDIYVKKHISPVLQMHGGNIKIIKIEPKDTLWIQLIGKCQSCNISWHTLKYEIKKKIISNFPQIKYIKNI